MGEPERISEDEGLLEKQDRKAEIAERQRKEDLRDILQIRAVKRYLWYLMGRTGIHGTSFSKHAGQMAFNEGERNIGLMLQAEIVDADPEAFLQMMTEEKIYG